MRGQRRGGAKRKRLHRLRIYNVRRCRTDFGSPSEIYRALPLSGQRRLIIPFRAEVKSFVIALPGATFIVREVYD